jgi:uncharacterized membrane protein
MTKSRMEAFSDGVLAIIITIMVLGLSAPKDSSLEALRPLIPTFLSYALSFVYLGIYWNNHHHMLQAAKHVSGGILWANLHLLFWLSLIPFATGWMGDTTFARWPVVLYGVVLLCAAVAYFILAKVLVAAHGQDSVLAKALGRDVKGKMSMALYAAALPLAILSPWISCAVYVVVAIMWLVPDRRIERVLPK